MDRSEVFSIVRSYFYFFVPTPGVLSPPPSSVPTPLSSVPTPSVLSPPPPKKVERNSDTVCIQKPGEPVLPSTGQRIQYILDVLCSLTASLLKATPTPLTKLSYSDTR